MRSLESVPVLSRPSGNRQNHPSAPRGTQGLGARDAMDTRVARRRSDPRPRLAHRDSDAASISRRLAGQSSIGRMVSPSRPAYSRGVAVTTSQSNSTAARTADAASIRPTISYVEVDKARQPSA